MQYESRTIRVLLIDDDRDDFLITKSIFDSLPADHYTLDWVGGYDAGLKAISEGTHDLYLLDYRLEARTGIDLLIEAKAYNPSAAVILLTGQGQYEIDRKATQAGAADYLEKDRLDAVLLERSIRHALLQKDFETGLKEKVRERTEELEQLNAVLRREIAVRKQAENALREADQRKDEFLATLAHELRNPLAPIRNSLLLMQLKAHEPETVARSRDTMNRQVIQMVRLIDDLLDVSRISQGKLRLMPEKMRLSELIETALEISGPQIAEAKLELIQKHESTNIELVVDKVRMAQVLSNLLNNAAKYSELGGTIRLESKRIGGELAISIIDSGMGIAPESLPRIFELFTQVDRSVGRIQGGLGIGLAIVAHIVQLHGGRVTAHSEGLGRGATFTVILPLEAGQQG